MKQFKEKMKEKIALYSDKKYLDGYIRNEFLTEDGDADIFLKLSHIDELINPRTIYKQLDLLPTIYDYIESKTAMLDSDIQIHFHILGLSLSSSEQEQIRHIIKEHYAIELYKKQKEYIQYRNKIINLILIGFIFLIAYALLYLFTKLNFFLEVFGFLFSFSLWEGCDCFIYSFLETKQSREDITQNLLMDVDFEDHYQEKA